LDTPPSAIAQGLTRAKAADLLARYGPNEITGTKTNPFLKIISYFWGPIPWMTEAAVVLSALGGRWADFYIILVLLIANAVVGFWEEFQAGNAVAALKAKLALKARGKRAPRRRLGMWFPPMIRRMPGWPFPGSSWIRWNNSM
jgi:H+-transporting ATPase